MTTDTRLHGAEPNTLIDPSSWNSKPWILLVLLLAVGAVFLWVQSIQLPILRGPHGYVLLEPDSYMHWHMVRRALAGEGVRIRWMNEDNAPYGRLNEWMSPTTILGVTLTRMFEIFGGEPREEALKRTASHWMGPIIGLASILALGLLGRRAWEAWLWRPVGRWPWPAPFWPGRCPKTEFGYVGHLRPCINCYSSALVGGRFAWRKSNRK